MKDFDIADVILGIRLSKTEFGYTLKSITLYWKNFENINSSDVIPTSVSYWHNYSLKKNKEESVSHSKYAKIIGSVMYLTNRTRQDIAYAVNRLIRCTHNPRSEHWHALAYLLRYLRGTIDVCLHYSKFPYVLKDIVMQIG